MKNILLAAVLALSPSVSFADGHSGNYAVITAVYPIYENRQSLQYETVCRDVEVPIYQSNGGGSNIDVITGAIVGGAIGNQFGNGNGKDAMTVLGALFGANVAANRSSDQIVGYRIEQQCDRVARNVNEATISSYEIEYTLNGYTYRQETSRRYVLGQRVLVQPTLR